ncbi:pimeloyl-ACP methyl ester carboxylesterase [Herbihabitans rhizosphaerae]|uniref:Pimeloyl-ACP methyl ester carboxylesterase n=1 Tax=Herbihabitans rhizosphaerae TaxID=1872711 RepID=A0A4Q7L4H1_9PSEU|nr:alpha/beta hydrolase [Herbihabitans rhizosphaerae]RZS43680.1 pimeloyl-ACP methyl ester carboxylesterase [Herbihabitans rhizosphaerae]
MDTRVIGSGPHRVLVLHDWLVPTDAWGSFLDYLDGVRFTYALLDARGYGRRRDVAGEYTMPELAGDVIALADQLGWDEFSLIGHSMGGKAIQRVMADAPTRVRNLVAITPTPAGRVLLTDQKQATFASAAHSADARRELLDFSTGNRCSRAWLRHMVTASENGSTTEAFAAYPKSFLHNDFTADVTGNPTPVKVIAGEHDLAIPEQAIRNAWSACYPNLEIEVLANAGHYPMHETPVALAAAIENFLNRWWSP